MAKPKKLKKPAISVIVVSKTELAMAGSISNLSRMSGMMAPNNPASNKFIIVESAITIPR